MGLDIVVGQLVAKDTAAAEDTAGLRKALKGINTVLKKNGLPSHKEPTKLPPLKSRASLQGYPYSYLHYLRRFAAHAKAKPKWKPKPFPESQDPAEDPVVFDELAMLSSHLLCHSDCDGYYVPVDFDEPLFDDDSLIPGGMLGSSQGLMRELVAVAPLLGITLENGQLTNAEAKRINGLIKRDEPFSVEHIVWLSLFEAARLSIEYGTVISFC